MFFYFLLRPIIYKSSHFSKINFVSSLPLRLVRRTDDRDDDEEEEEKEEVFETSSPKTDTSSLTSSSFKHTHKIITNSINLSRTTE